MSRSRAIPHWQRTVQIVSLTQIAILVGFNAIFPFIPLLFQQLGVTDLSQVELWSGLAIGGSGITMAFASPLWGLLADRFGRKAMLVRAIGAGSISLALQAVVERAWQLVAVRLVQGVFTGTQTAAAMLIASIVPKERTGAAIGLMNAAVQVGNLIGPVLGGFAVAAIGLKGAILFGAAVLALCTIVTILTVEDTPSVVPAAAAAPSWGLRDVLDPFAWPALRGVLIIGGLIQVSYAGTIPLIAIYVQELARPAWLSSDVAIGLAFALSALAAAVAMPILGAHADRHDARQLLVVSLALVAVALVPQALVPNVIVFLVLRLLVGVGLAGTTAAITVLTRAGAPVGGEGRAFGTLAAAQNMGWGFGPIVGSALAAVIGIPGVYLAGAAGMLMLVLAAARSRTWFVLAEAVPEPVALRASDPVELP